MTSMVFGGCSQSLMSLAERLNQLEASGRSAGSQALAGERLLSGASYIPYSDEERAWLDGLRSNQVYVAVESLVSGFPADEERCVRPGIREYLSRFLQRGAKTVILSATIQVGDSEPLPAIPLVTLVHDETTPSGTLCRSAVSQGRITPYFLVKADTRVSVKFEIFHREVADLSAFSSTLDVVSRSLLGTSSASWVMSEHTRPMLGHYADGLSTSRSFERSTEERRDLTLIRTELTDDSSRRHRGLALEIPGPNGEPIAEVRTLLVLKPSLWVRVRDDGSGLPDYRDRDPQDILKGRYGPGEKDTVFHFLRDEQRSGSLGHWLEADDGKIGHLCRLVYDDLAHTLRLSAYDATAALWAVLRLYAPHTSWAAEDDSACLTPERRRMMSQLGLELPEPSVAEPDSRLIGSRNDLLNILVAGLNAESPEMAEHHFGKVLSRRLLIVDKTRFWIPEEMREVEGDDSHVALNSLSIKSAGCYWSPKDRAGETASMAVLLDQQSELFSLQVSFAEDRRIRMLWLDHMTDELQTQILNTRTAQSPCSVFLIAGHPPPTPELLSEETQLDGH